MKIPKRINDIIEELKDQYLEEDRCNRPWIIGFSGGKDSTVLLTLTWLALQQLKEVGYHLMRQVYVVCNDTMVENPVIEEYVTVVLDTIRKAAREQELPITVATTTPELEDTFWCCVIGKGYPVPNNSFRFCTEKMKIKPTSKFITDQVVADGEAIVLVGTRLSESQQRERSIRRHEIKGHRLSKHPLNSNTYTYAPIKELMLEEVWWIINAMPSPWGFDNQVKPLLDFRDRLIANRNVSEYRSETRRNGQWAVDENGHKMGNYTMEYRIQLLKELLIVQKETQDYRSSIDLITNQELIAIQVIWYRDGNFTTTVNDIYNEVYGYNIPNTTIGLQERLLLEKACSNNHSHYQLIQELLALQKSKVLLMRKYGLATDLETRLEAFVKEENL